METICSVKFAYQHFQTLVTGLKRVVEVPQDTVTTPFLDIHVGRGIRAGQDMSQPHLRILRTVAHRGPDRFLVALVLQGEDVLIAFHQVKTILRLLQFTTTLDGFGPVLFVHIEFHQHHVAQGTGKTSVTGITNLILGGQSRQGRIDFVLDVLHHLLLRQTRCHSFGQRIVQQFGRGNLDRSIHVIQDISQPAATQMQFCLQTCFHLLVH